MIFRNSDSRRSNLKLPGLRAGFTLMEILVATGTFMIVMVIGVAIFASSLGSSSTSEQYRINAQASRFAFESLSREIRLAKGLVYLDPQDDQELRKMLIPPFDVVTGPNNAPYDPVVDAALQPVIRIYQAARPSVNSQGQGLYTITRRIYNRDTATGQLTLSTQVAYEETPVTAATIYTTITAAQAGTIEDLPWQTKGQAAQLLPSSLQADQLKIVQMATYPLSGQRIDSLRVQPFIRLDVTVSSSQYNKFKNENQKIRNTFRTMIVPRNFVNPFEVIQPGVQGGGSS